ncbi:MAG: hypothetical protein A2Y73_00510 [Chloroflexi bacterium RBG_13_56_8]|nr:MAG: hypothetical protein A2Y73_00510 [Chloroflexi bacterium RBG_13_56_8]
MDLHIHTSASKCYEEPKATYLDILRKAEAEGLDIIAFADHNTVAGYAAMKQEVSDLERWEASGRLQADEKARLGEYRRLLAKILVLPGFEFTATFGFHILGIFDQSISTRSLEHVLLSLNVPVEALDAGETQVGATCDVLTAYHIMAEAGALVIAAHANSSHGVAMLGLNFGGQTRIAYTQDPDLHALEVTDLDSKRRRTTASFFNGSKPEYPRRMHCIQSSDAHRVTGASGSRQSLGVGERTTEVLLPEVSFTALKELFLSTDYERVRPYGRTAEPFDYVESVRKEAPTIVQSFHEQITRRGGRMHAILRDVVAFANTNGGTVYVGVSSNPRSRPKGVENPEEDIKQLRLEIERMITPPIDVSFGVLTSRGKNIIRIGVPKGTEPPYVLEGSKIYLRQEAETSLAMRDEIVGLIKQTAGKKSARPPSRRPVTVESDKAPSVPEPTEKVEAEAVEDSFSVTPPHTGVEIAETVSRNGVQYHTMRDLRNGNEVRNVTRTSARRLWRYAIALKEKSTFQESKVSWSGDLGLWHKYLRASRPHYDLVQRGPDGEIRIYYGVTENGIHGPWRAVVGSED